MKTYVGTFVSNTNELMSRVYPDLLSIVVWLSKHSIIAPLNKTTYTHTINTAMVARLASYLVTVLSIDPWIQYLMNHKYVIYFPEFLQVLGLPCNLWSLKVIAPIIILWSLDPKSNKWH